MKFSLIIGTLNRSNTIEHCLRSLNEQSYRDFEIIIVDQSDDCKTEEIIKKQDDSRIVYKHVSIKGLSKARNEGLKYARGDYICLIDDDAYYDREFLQEANQTVITNHRKKTIYSGYIYNTDTHSAFASYDNKHNCKPLSIRQVIRSCPSAGLVIPIEVIKKCGGFDERLGVGAEFGAGEETDLLLRAISNGFNVVYNEKMILKHPYPERKNKSSNEESANKMASYYSGIGALYKKQIVYEKNYRVSFSFFSLCIKFIMKYLLFFKFDHKCTKMEIEGFIQGAKMYSI